MFQVIGLVSAINKLKYAQSKLPKDTDTIIQLEAIKAEAMMRRKIRAGIPPALTERTLMDKLKHGYSPIPLIRTGALINSIGSRKISENVAEVFVDQPYALYHEFGAPTIGLPARPFFYPTMAEIEFELNEKLAKVL